MIDDRITSKELAIKKLKEMAGYEQKGSHVKPMSKGQGGLVDRGRVQEILEELPDIQSPVEDLECGRIARIEAAIRYLDKQPKTEVVPHARMDETGDVVDVKITLGELIDFGRWILTGEKDQDTWEDKVLGLEETPKQKGG